MQRVKRERQGVLRGITIVEVTVTIAILSTLVALLLPAVQDARRAARATRCKSNLSQIGKAHHGFHATNNAFPTQAWWTEAELAGHLDGVTAASGETVSAVLECPDDYLNRGHRLFRTSYLKNAGDLSDRIHTGYCGATRASDIIDGLSQTACMSERMQLDYDSSGLPAHQDPRSLMYYVPTVMNIPSQLPQFVNDCLSSSDFSPYTYISNGQIYTHVFTPNRKSCYGGPYSSASDIFHMIVTPSSRHFDGVHVLLTDGAVRVVSSHCDPMIWKSLGTIQGGEVFGDF